MKNFSYFLLLFFVITSDAHAQLTGVIRMNFIDSFLFGCYQSQRSADINKSADERTLQQYCRCSATYIADLFDNKRVQDIESGEEKMNPDLLRLAENFCRKNFSKY